MSPKQFFICLFFAVFLSNTPALSFDDDSYSPIQITIEIKKDTYKVREPVKGFVVLENDYPAAIPGVFIIQMFRNGQFVLERVTSIRHIPTGTTRFEFKNFGIPEFNNAARDKGRWTIKVHQQGQDDSYAAQATVEVVASLYTKKASRHNKFSY